LSKKIPLKRDP